MIVVVSCYINETLVNIANEAGAGGWGKGNRRGIRSSINGRAEAGNWARGTGGIEGDRTEHQELL